MWLQDETCGQVVQDRWRPSPDLQCSKEFMKTLKGIAYDLKHCEIVYFGNITRKIKELRKDLHRLQKDPRAHNLRAQMKEIEDELHNLFKKEETMWHQRSRTN